MSHQETAFKIADDAGECSWVSTNGYGDYDIDREVLASLITEALEAAEQRGEAMWKQDRDAQFAHNTSLVERLEESEKNLDMYANYLATIQGIVDGTGSTGNISWQLHEHIAALVAKGASDDAG